MITETMYIKDWFAEKIRADAPYYVCDAWLDRFDPEQVIKESEKAYCVRFEGFTPKKHVPSGFATWVPKSVIETKEQREESDRLEEERRNARFKAGQEKHDRLIQLARDNGIKGVRRTMRTMTILGMLTDAGIEVSI